MHPEVRDTFLKITEPHEDDVPHMYRDSLGLVTVAIGQLVDNGPRIKAEALDWPWTLGNGLPASNAQVEAEYDRIKAGPLYQQDKRGTERLATMHLARPDRLNIFLNTLAVFERSLIAQLPDWGTWPADAQLAMLNAVWNLGPSLTGWPALWQRLRQRDWLYASDNYQPKRDGKLVQAPRWTQNRLLWTYAALVDSDVGRAAGLGLLRNRLIFDSPQAVIHAGKLAEYPASAWLVQRQLRATGHYTLALDGQWGPRSAAALRAFAGKIPAPLPSILRELGRKARLIIPVKD